MNRREFLQFATAAVAATALPALACDTPTKWEAKPITWPVNISWDPAKPGADTTVISTWVGFDPGYEYGDLMYVTDPFGQAGSLSEIPIALADSLVHSLKKVIPPEYRSRVMILTMAPRNDTYASIAWKYIPEHPVEWPRLLE